MKGSRRSFEYHSRYGRVVAGSAPAAPAAPGIPGTFIWGGAAAPGTGSPAAAAGAPGAPEAAPDIRSLVGKSGPEDDNQLKELQATRTVAAVASMEL